jgi:hypothetical protein
MNQSKINSKPNIHTEHKNCCDESYWTRLLRNRGIFHGDCYKELQGKHCKIVNHKISTSNYDTDTFTKNFAFWKIYLIIFFLLGIAIANLVDVNTKGKTWEYLTKNTGNFFLELLYLFGAFFVSTIFMYIIRINATKVPSRTYIMSAVVILIFCILKHFAFEFSGLYRFNFGSKDCNKHEPFKSDTDSKTTTNSDSNSNSNSNSDSDSDSDSDHDKTCKCDSGFFSGLFWNGLGYQGMVITVILVLFFGISLINPAFTEKFFNYEFSRQFSICVLGFMLFFFTVGSSITEMNIRDNSCLTQNENLIRVKDGCAVISILFMLCITILVFFHFILKKKFITEFMPNNFNDNTFLKPYNDCFWQNGYMRFILTLIESIIIFLIFACAEAGIEGLRLGHDIKHVLEDPKFWKKSLSMTLPGIVVVQFLLEYTNWFKEHLFNDEDYQKDNRNHCYQGALLMYNNPLTEKQDRTVHGHSHQIGHA